MNTTMNRNRFGALQAAIVILALATAAIHLWLGIPNNLSMFILNGVGYLVLVAALYLPQLNRYHVWIRWALILYTAVTVIAWALIGERNLIGFVDKAIEVALIILLFIEGRR